MKKYFCLPLCVLFAYIGCFVPFFAFAQSMKLSQDNPVGAAVPDLGPREEMVTGNMRLAEQTPPSIDNIDDFHPEVKAEKVPMPDVVGSGQNPSALAVVPFEQADEGLQAKNTIKLYPTKNHETVRQSSEPNNPVNNVISVAKTVKQPSETLKAPELQIAPLQKAPEALLGRPG